MGKTMVFAGTYSQTLTLGTGEVVHGKGEGIYSFELNMETGALTRLSVQKDAPNPTYLAIDRQKKHLYSTNELKQFSGLESAAASAYDLDGETGALTPLNRRITGGTDACHIALDDENRYAFVANFMSGSVCILPLEADGSLGKPTCFLQHKGSSVDQNRQRGPHAHAVVLDRRQRRALVPDLGTDEVVVYDIDWDKGYYLRSAAKNAVTALGEGPRHLVFNRAGTRAYLVNEMGSSVYVYSYDQATGAMVALQRLSTLPADYHGDSTCAAIKMHPNGKLLYASNRGHDSVATYRIAEDTGLLTLLSVQSTGGQIPRDFDIDPTGTFLIAANQASSELTVFRIQPETGTLTQVFREENVYTVTCVLIADMRENA